MTQKTNSKTEEINLISNLFSVNGLHNPSKREILDEWIIKHHLSVDYIRNMLDTKTNWLKMKDEKDIPYKTVTKRS